MTSGTNPQIDPRLDRALFLSPLAAAGVLVFARVVAGLLTAQFARPFDLLFWVVLESTAFSAVWLPAGWLAAWGAWRTNLHRRISHGVVKVLLATLLAAFVATCAAGHYYVAVGFPREVAIALIGLALNLAVFLHLQGEP